MNDRITQSRSRSILRLLRQNFPKVEGPVYDKTERIFYRVHSDGPSAEHQPGVEIEFPSGFLSESTDHFGTLTLEALQQAKRLLKNPNGTARQRRGITVFRNRSVRLWNEPIRTGPIEMLYTVKPVER